MPDETEALKEQIRAKVTPAKAPAVKDMVSTGSTLLNLAISGKPQAGIPKGTYVFLVGDSDSGKTWLTMSIAAEVARNPHFADYRIIYDPVEGGATMDVAHYFGQALANKLEYPRVVDGVGVASETVEDFYFNADDAVKQGKPFLWIEDSMDALMGKVENNKFEERKKAARKGPAALEKVKGDYGDGKAKVNSGNIRGLRNRVAQLGSILIVVGQTRDVLEERSFEEKTHAGGHALKFYAGVQLWTSPRGAIVKTVLGKPRQVGINVQIKVKKNRITGKEWTVQVPIYHKYGIDDTGSCVDWLVEEGHWDKPSGSPNVVAEEFDHKGTRDALIRKIEDAGQTRQLRMLVAEVWEKIEEGCQLKGRKPRYE